MRKPRIILIGAGATAAIAASVYVAGTAAAASTTVLTLTNHLDTNQPVDVAPAGPSVGDSFLVGSHVIAGGSGRTAASCTFITASAGGLKQCEVDFILSYGTITTRGLTNAANKVVQLIVTGGTGRYAGKSGQGTLTPNPTGSIARLRLR
ncbi:hypothetical protein acdb102_39510 [Acidothermaceae bacterium B102]|nr:hypothetical protein acdb102_39510 [Acidothermaceae bacterium B102]